MSNFWFKEGIKGSFRQPISGISYEYSGDVQMNTAPSTI